MIKMTKKSRAACPIHREQQVASQTPTILRVEAKPVGKQKRVEADPETRRVSRQDE